MIEGVGIVAVVAVIGLLIGSFLNVLAARYDRLATVAAGRSACPHCDTTIAWYDLVPVVSFVLLGGKCRQCRKPISWQYPLVELLTAGLAVHLYLSYGLSWIALALFIIFALLLATAVVDFHHYLVPDSYVVPATMLAFGVAFFLPDRQPFDTLWGALLGGGGLAALVLLSREQWMGAGDIGLGLIMGLLAGLSGTFVGLVFAFVIGALVGLILMVLRRKQMKDMIAFGPFLVLATYIATLWGPMIWQKYLLSIGFYF